MQAQDWEKNAKFGGPDGGGVLIREVNFVEKKARTKLAFVCEAATRQVRGAWEALPGDDLELTVEMDVGMPDGTNALTEGKLKRQNTILSALSGTAIPEDDPAAWLDFLPGGEAYDKVLNTDKLHVTVNEWKDWKSFEFVAPRPKLTKDDVIARWAKRQEEAGGATEGEVVVAF